MLRAKLPIMLREGDTGITGGHVGEGGVDGGEGCGGLGLGRVLLAPQFDDLFGSQLVARGRQLRADKRMEVTQLISGIGG